MNTSRLPAKTMQPRPACLKNSPQRPYYPLKKIRQVLLSTALTMCLGHVCFAQVHINEIYASHTGADTGEYIELVGTPSMSLDGFVVCVVEGQGGGQGVLDRVWDLTGMTIPADGYFLMGNIAVPNSDYDLGQGPHTFGGVQDNIENGTETFYLLEIPNPLDIVDLENTLFSTNIDPDADRITVFGSSPALYTIIDHVAIMTTANDPHDVAHDAAVEVGPGGNFFPAGIFRPGDYPNDWCADSFLEFGDPTSSQQTPGSNNPACGTFTQGADECTFATQLGSGALQIVVDTNLCADTGAPATTGVQQPNCAMSADVWFEWTAATTGLCIISTCGPTTYDTQVAVWLGNNCTSTTLLACNDDSPSCVGFGSEVEFFATAGSDYLIQVGGGSQSGGAPGTLAMDIEPQLPADPCNDDPYEPNNSCETASDMPVYNHAHGLIGRLKVGDWDYYRFRISSGKRLNLRISVPDSNPPLSLEWQVATSNENQNPCTTGYRTPLDNDYEICNHQTPGDTIATVRVYRIDGPACDFYFINYHYDTSICSGIDVDHGPAGQTFCDPMDQNSTGQSTNLTGYLGVGSNSGSGLHLEATQGPPNEFAQVLVGTASTEPGLLISQGRLCLSVTGGNALGRYNIPGGNLNSIGAFDSSGTLINLVGTSSVPGNSGFDVPLMLPGIGGTITSGSTWHFQLWHRDSSAGPAVSNFSNGLSVTFP